MKVYDNPKIIVGKQNDAQVVGSDLISGAAPEPQNFFNNVNDFADFLPSGDDDRINAFLNYTGPEADGGVDTSGTDVFFSERKNYSSDNPDETAELIDRIFKRISESGSVKDFFDKEIPDFFNIEVPNLINDATKSIKEAFENVTSESFGSLVSTVNKAIGATVIGIGTIAAVDALVPSTAAKLRELGESMTGETSDSVGSNIDNNIGTDNSDTNELSTEASNTDQNDAETTSLKREAKANDTPAAQKVNAENVAAPSQDNVQTQTAEPTTLNSESMNPPSPVPASVETITTKESNKQDTPEQNNNSQDAKRVDSYPTTPAEVLTRPETSTDNNSNGGSINDIKFFFEDIKKELFNSSPQATEQKNNEKITTEPAESKASLLTPNNQADNKEEYTQLNQQLSVQDTNQPSINNSKPSLLANTSYYSQEMYKLSPEAYTESSRYKGQRIVEKSNNNSIDVRRSLMEMPEQFMVGNMISPEEQDIAPQGKQILSTTESLLTQQNAETASNPSSENDMQVVNMNSDSQQQTQAQPQFLTRSVNNVPDVSFDLSSFAEDLFFSSEPRTSRGAV